MDATPVVTYPGSRMSRVTFMVTDQLLEATPPSERLAIMEGAIADAVRDLRKHLESTHPGYIPGDMWIDGPHQREQIDADGRSYRLNGLAYTVVLPFTMPDQGK
jgi:hypothetical protein